MVARLQHQPASSRATATAATGDRLPRAPKAAQRRCRRRPAASARTRTSAGCPSRRRASSRRRPGPAGREQLPLVIASRCAGLIRVLPQVKPAKTRPEIYDTEHHVFSPARCPALSARQPRAGAQHGHRLLGRRRAEPLRDAATGGAAVADEPLPNRRSQTESTAIVRRLSGQASKCSKNTSTLQTEAPGRSWRFASCSTSRASGELRLSSLRSSRQSGSSSWPPKA